MWDSVRDLVQNNKYQELREKAHADMERRGFVQTNNFGWVLEKDLLDKRFDFLAKDRGVPVLEKEISITTEEKTSDAYGKEKTKTKTKFVIVTTETDAYKEWRKLCVDRKYTREQDGVSFDSLIDEFDK